MTTTKTTPPLYADGYDVALIGYAELPSGQYVILYDRTLAIEALIAQGMSYEEAADHFSYNTERALPYAGAGAPMFVEVVGGATPQAVRETIDEDLRIAGVVE